MVSRITGAGEQYGVALVLGFAIAFVYAAIVSPLTYPFAIADSSYLLEAARNAMAGNGLVTSTVLGAWPVEAQPIYQWPPGFPVILALGSSLLGVDPIWLAPKITWLTWALLPAALVFALRPVVKSWPALIVGLLVMLSPGVIDRVGHALTDVTFLFLTILWLGLLYRGGQNGTRPMLLILSGAVCGLAYAVRNAGIAAFVAIAMAYASLVLLKVMSLKAALRRIAWWSAGASLILIPLLAWNVSVFGVLQPYHMTPSDVGLVANIRYFLAASINYVFAFPGLIDVVLWRGALSVALWAGIVILVWLMRGRIGRAWNSLVPHDKEMLTVLAAYVAAGAAVVIVARSTYQMGEFIGLRHVMQYHWILFALCAVAFVRRGEMPRWALVGLAGVTLAIAGLRFVNLSHDIEMRRTIVAIAETLSDRPVDAGSSDYPLFALKPAAVRDTELLQAIKDLPSTTVIISNLDDFMRVETGRRIFEHNLSQDCDLPAELSPLVRGDRQPTSAVYLLFPSVELLRSGCWAKLENAGYKRFDLGVARPYLISLDALAIAAGRASASR